MAKNMPVYLDYHATTPCDEQVIEAMLPYFTAQFGNPSATGHENGRKASAVIMEVKANIAKFIGGIPEGVIITSGATEANNIAIMGHACATGTERNEILIGSLEHASVSKTALSLEKLGFVVKKIPANRDGFITADALKGLISDKTRLVSVMTVNHELGTIQPIKDLAATAHSSGALFHTDATQGVGKVPIDVDAMDIDMLSLSGHKFYGPQGVGALYVRQRPPVDLIPVMEGGRQQGVRSGTIPLALSVGLAKACDVAASMMEREAERLQELSVLLCNTLNACGASYKINGSVEGRLPGSLNICFADVCAEDVQTELAHDICVATGSACATKNKSPSSVLKAIGLSDEEAGRSIRISFGRKTGEQDVIFAAEKLGALAAKIAGNQKAQAV